MLNEISQYVVLYLKIARGVKLRRRRQNGKGVGKLVSGDRVSALADFAALEMSHTAV